MIDSGSTHNFLDPSITKQVGCVIVPIHKLLVKVADGSIINIVAMFPDFKCTMQGEELSAEMRLLPLGGYVMVLGVQWLRGGACHYGPQHTQFSIHYKGTILKLLAKTSDEAQLKFMSWNAFHKYCNNSKIGVMA